PNIVTIHDFGRSGGFYFLLMEFVDGVNLRALLQTRKLTPEEGLAIVPPLCEALQFAHDRGIVHRDIKPENLLLDRDGEIKIGDFGIAKMMEDGKSESRSAGTPGYMAPEQASGSEAVDSRADIYSMGVVFYELLTGERPSGDLKVPSKKVSIDVRLDEIVLKALEEEPELRWQTADELRTQVETIVEESREPASAPFRPVGGHRGWCLFFGLLVVLSAILISLRWTESSEAVNHGSFLIFPPPAPYSVMNSRTFYGVPGGPWILEWEKNVAGGTQNGDELQPWQEAWPSWVVWAVGWIALGGVVATSPRFEGRASFRNLLEADGGFAWGRCLFFLAVLASGMALFHMGLIALIASFGRGAPSPGINGFWWVIGLVVCRLAFEVGRARSAPGWVKAAGRSLSREIRRESSEWKITCQTCNWTRSVDEMGGVRYGAYSKSKRMLIHCSGCGRLRMARVERAAPAGPRTPEERQRRHARNTRIFGFWALFGLVLGGLTAVIPFSVARGFPLGPFLMLLVLPFSLILAGLSLGVVYLVRKNKG
ncbi:MAG: serine/threonine-protein kinase, partial [Verrucomicrobiota bacterium]